MQAGAVDIAERIVVKQAGALHYIIWITRRWTLIYFSAMFIQNWMNPIMQRAKSDKLALPVCDNARERP